MFYFIVPLLQPYFTSLTILSDLPVFQRNTPGWDVDSIAYQFYHLDPSFKLFVLQFHHLKIIIIIIPITYCTPLWIIANIHVCKGLCKCPVPWKCTTNNTEEDDVVDHDGKEKFWDILQFHFRSPPSLCFLFLFLTLLSVVLLSKGIFSIISHLLLTCLSYVDS